MKIVSLMEDTPGGNGCLFEHGFSLYVETKSHRILADTGASCRFLENAKRLGIVKIQNSAIASKSRPHRKTQHSSVQASSPAEKIQKFPSRFPASGATQIIFCSQSFLMHTRPAYAHAKRTI